MEVPPGDLLIHCGDYTGRYSAAELQDFNEWLGTLPFKHRLFVPGNHDAYFEECPSEARAALTNATTLIDEAITLGGLRIYGTPWVPRFYDWSFMKAEAQLQPIYNMIPEGLDVLITHGPPQWLLDQNGRGHHCGSSNLANIVAAKKPRLHVFGHIHESYGERSFNGTHYVNAASLDGYYCKIQPPIVVDL